MTESHYVHGYSAQESLRLVEQAEYWRELLTWRDLAYAPGERLLEIGCAVGATLGQLGRAVPGLVLAGIDRKAGQLRAANAHLASLGLTAELRAADARALPWPDGSFDHVYSIWLLEHVKEQIAILEEARRVLRPGGSIRLIETDYTTFQVFPESEDYDALRDAFTELFRRRGDAIAGRRLGAWLATAGFARVVNEPVGFHFFRRPHDDALRAHVDYMAGFTEPAIPAMASELGCDEAKLRRGLAWLRGIPDRPDGSLTQIVYRATATR